jgi:hypothetical protein
MSRLIDERFWEEAYKLARSGKHSSYLSIEWELKQRFRKAHSLLGDDDVRDRLNRICEQAQRAAPPAAATMPEGEQTSQNSSQNRPAKIS